VKTLAKSKANFPDTIMSHIKLVILRGDRWSLRMLMMVLADFWGCGKDVLMEASTKKPLRTAGILKIAKCRLMTAGVVGQPLPNRRLEGGF